MRGDIVYRVYGVHEGRQKDHFFDAYPTVAEAKAAIERLKRNPHAVDGWVEKYHNKGFQIREARVETDFEIPALPKPRDRYAIRATTVKSTSRNKELTNVEVLRREEEPGEWRVVYEYERDFRMLQTFEPFRQENRDFALISPKLTSIAVLDLDSGEVIAEEIRFAPVGFFVPDWWDVHNGRCIPGSAHWTPDDEWPTGQFGFVWGCVPPDDVGAKVQYLDLSQIQKGVISCDERFGYVALATTGHELASVSADGELTCSPSPPSFIDVMMHDGVPRAELAVELEFDLRSGELDAWQLKNLSGEEHGPK